MDNNRSGSNFFSGFLLGALVGAGIVFLLGTEKGKKLLKAISEEGEGKISNMLNKIENSVDLEDTVLEDELAVAPKRKITAEAPEKKPPARNASASVAGGKVRRFFRGISRNLN